MGFELGCERCLRMVVGCLGGFQRSLAPIPPHPNPLPRRGEGIQGKCYRVESIGGLRVCQPASSS